MDRLSTVSYATDLLRAHQIRRENTSLHKQLLSCHSEITALRGELYEMKAAFQLVKDAATRTDKLAESHKIQLEDQSANIARLLDTNSALQIEVMSLNKACNQLRYNEQEERAVLERKVEEIKLHTLETARAWTQYDGDIMDVLNTLRTAIERKAGAQVVTEMMDQLNAPNETSNPSITSKSCIVESIEHTGPSFAEERNPHRKQLVQLLTQETDAVGIQVRDSQLAQDKGKVCTNQREYDLDSNQIERHSEATVPDDVDLDANACTISYAGHRFHEVDGRDSMQMLPEPHIEASKLAKINTLQQERYESWKTYYLKGQSIINALPKAFEEAVVQQFLNGMYDDYQKKQCQQWLDSAGRSWKEVGKFASLCSQLNAEFGVIGDSESTSSESTVTVDDERASQGQPRAQSKASVLSKPVESNGRVEHTVPTLRRSERLMDKAQMQTTNNNTACESQPWLSESEVQDKGLFAGQRPTQKETSLKNRGSLGKMRLQSVANISRADVVQGQVIQTHRFSSQLNITDSTNVWQHDVNVVRNSKHNDAEKKHDPLLVPAKRRAEVQALESSDDEGYLYSRKRLRGVTDTAQRQQNRMKKGRLPLPPPPEIPILSTSTED